MTSLVEVHDVSKKFAPRLSLGEKIAASLGSAIETRIVHALDRVSLAIDPGEVVGLVGESGCGKSTLGRVIAGILTPTSGTARIAGDPVMTGGRKRTTRVQMVFQDPFASLDPRMRVGRAIAEGPLAHGIVGRNDAGSYVSKWLEAVGLDPDFADRFPHQFSGGQRQRIAIARALAAEPQIVILDESVAALDVSIQAQILNLLADIREQTGISYILISHDLAVVRQITDEAVVMHCGKVVERGSTADVLDHPQQPYTQLLRASVPRPGWKPTRATRTVPTEGTPS